MKAVKRIVRRVAVRVFLAAPFYWAGLRLLLSMERVKSSAELAGAAVQALFGMSVLIVGTVILLMPLARLAALPFISIYFPTKEEDEESPGPSYYVPHAKRVKGMYDDAIEEYERIARIFPNEVRPYLEIIDICVVNLGDIDRATDMYHLGMMKLKLKRDKKILDDMYTATVSRLNPDPEWLAEQKARKISLDSRDWLPEDRVDDADKVKTQDEVIEEEEARPVSIEDLASAAEYASELSDGVLPPGENATEEPVSVVKAETPGEYDLEETDEAADEEPFEGDYEYADDQVSVEEAARDGQAALTEAQNVLRKDSVEDEEPSS